MRKIIGLMGVMAAILLLTGCPTETEMVSEGGEDYIAAAALVNEKAKYQRAVTLNLAASAEDLDVTEQLIQLKPGKSAGSGVTVSVGAIAFDTNNLDVSSWPLVMREGGRVFFTGVFPGEGEFNGKVITLLFEKDGESAALDVLAVIKKEGSAPDPDRITVSEENSFVIFGYDVINSSYINRGDVDTGHPILDLVKVNQVDMVRQAAVSSSQWESVSGESVTELMQSLNVSVKAEYKAVVFSGKVESEFSTSSGSKTTTRYAKGRGSHLTRDEYLKDTTPSTLRALLHDSFISAVNTKSPADILDDYGTHLIARAYWGGTAEFNYSYTGTELTSEQDLKIALNASYAGAGGSATEEAKQKATELNTNSSVSISSRGGNNTSFMTVEDFNKGYAAWVASIPAKPDLCGIPNYENSLIPIWTIAAQVNPAKATQIEAEFNRRADLRGIALGNFTAALSYVTAFAPVTVTTLPSAYTNWVLADIYKKETPTTTVLALTNGGRFAYKLDRTNHQNAIADIRWMIDDGATPGWTSIPGTNLEYRTVNPSDTWAVDFVGSYVGNYTGDYYVLESSFGYKIGNIENVKTQGPVMPISITGGYEWVSAWFSDYLNTQDSSTVWYPRHIVYNLDASNKGKDVFLTVHKAPFKW